MSLSIPFHSELQKEITLWLQANRNLTIEEKVVHIKNLLISANLDAATILHYAAIGFIGNDVLMVNANKLPENLMLAANIAKAIGERLEKIPRKKGGDNRWNGDPKKAEKAFVESCWIHWQENPSNYKYKSDFAVDMLNKCEHLKSQKKIEDWCREWEKSHPASRVST